MFLPINCLPLKIYLQEAANTVGKLPEIPFSAVQSATSLNIPKWYTTLNCTVHTPQALYAYKGEKYPVLGI